MAETPTPTPTVTLRRGRVGDAAALHDLGTAVVPATYGQLDPAYAGLMLREWWSVDNLARSLAAVASWVAEDAEGRLVGLANLGEHDGTPTMWKLYVHPDRHGTGLGGALLREVLAANGDRPLEVEVVAGNDAAEAFYRHHGFAEFRRTPETRYPAMTLIWMRRETSAAHGPTSAELRASAALTTCVPALTGVAAAGRRGLRRLLTHRRETHG